MTTLIQIHPGIERSTATSIHVMSQELLDPRNIKPTAWNTTIDWRRKSHTKLDANQRDEFSVDWAAVVKRARDSWARENL